MNFNFNASGNKAQTFLVLWVLENYTDENRTLKQEDIVDLLGKHGHVTERKSVAKDLKLLYDLGYKVHGVVKEYDKNGKKLPTQRGKIWLEREISDAKLKLLIDSVLFSSYIGKAEAKELVDNLISLGSRELKKKSASARIDGGNIYHQDNVSFFNELAKINQAMIEVEGVSKKIAFKYAQYKDNGEEIKLVKEKEHIVSPYFFVSKKGNYYLVGYNHKAQCLWHYRMDYVKDVEILKENALAKDQTALKGKSTGKYIAEHPYMFSGPIKGIDIKVSADRLGIVMDMFGTSFEKLDNADDYITIRIYCSENDAFHFAMQYGGYIEVLQPQDLRDRIRTHIETMMFRYQSGDGDKYTEAIRFARRHKVLYLEGIDLRGKTKHLSLKNIREIRLSNNNIDNVDFLKNMPRLRDVSIKNNPVTNIDVLKNCKNVNKLQLENLKLENINVIADLPIERLHLGLGRTENLNAVLNVPTLKYITATYECAYNNPTLAYAWEELEKNKEIMNSIIDNEYETVNTNTGTFLNAYYPYNIMKKVFGRENVWVGSHDDITLAVDRFVDKFSGKEKQYLDLVYRQRVSDLDARKALGISTEEYRHLRLDIDKKFTNRYYMGDLEKFVEEEDFNSNNFLDLMSRKKQIEKNLEQNS